MQGTNRAETAIPVPFISSSMQIEPDWIDINGHLNMAYYNVLFDNALGEALAFAGLDDDYIKQRNLSFFTGEVHLIYKRELHLQDNVRVRLQFLDFDEKRLHIFEELYHATEGWVSASCELISLHIDLSTRRVAPFPADILKRLALVQSAHAALPRPASAGRSITMPHPANRKLENTLIP